DNAWQGVGRSALCFNLSLTLAAPCLVVFVWECNPVAAGLVMCLVTMTFLKLVSYHMVNFWCRQQKASRKNHKRCISLEGETTPVMPANGICADGPRRNALVYPDNLRIDNVYFFMVAPTLCYELNFPRSSAIRKTFLFRRFLESLLLLLLILALVEQLMMPVVQPTAEPAEMAGSCPAELSVSVGREERRIPTALEQFLKAAVINIFIWLVIFYWFFHSTLNMTAEVLRFADREFYRDWWNAETVQYFWQNWNVPVYHWCLRHLYRPLLGTGMSRFNASCFVFLVSAFFHEVSHSSYTCLSVGRRSRSEP
ncbi:diacylglycerol O-acyltransferase 1 isoform X1, partial [Ixodes scapularis]